MSVERLFGDGASVFHEDRYQLLLLANVNGALGAVIVSPVLESLTGPFGVPSTRLGLMMTLFTAPSVLGIPIAGAIADRVGRKPVLVAALLLFGGGGTAIAFTTDYEVALALRAVQGIGYSGIIPIVITSIGDIYDGSHETTAHGLRFSSSGGAQAVFPLLAGVLMAFSWRYPFLLFAVAFPIAALVYVRLDEPTPPGAGRPDAPSESPDPSVYLRNLLRALRRPRVSAVLLALGVPAFVWITFLTYNSFVVVEVFGLDPAYAGVLLTVLSVVNAGAASQSGRVASWLGGATIPLVLANVGLSLGVATFAVAPTFPIACVGVALVGVGQGLAFSLLRSVITDRADDELRGGIVGIGESIIRLSNSLAPLLTGVAIGYLRSEAGFRAALLTTLLGVALVGGLCGIGAIYVGCSRRYAAS